MDAVLLIARVVLAGVFALSGVAKLVDHAASRRAMIDFGVPGVLAGPLGRLLPVTELLVALSLLFVATAWWSAVAATTLLVIFTIGMLVNLARGRTPDCHCFGELHSRPIGPRTLARNGVLVAVAGIVVWQGHAGAGIGSLLSGLTATHWLIAVGGTLALLLLAAMAWLLVSLWQQQGRMLTRIETLERAQDAPARPTPAAAARALGVPTGTAAPGRAPTFTLAAVTGAASGLDDLLSRGKPVLLVFSDSGCGPCNELLPLIGRWQREHATWLSVVLISRGRSADLRAKAETHGLEGIRRARHPERRPRARGWDDRQRGDRRTGRDHRVRRRARA
jgi:thiol-disulfide isomerase/thioredoxin